MIESWPLKNGYVLDRSVEVLQLNWLTFRQIREQEGKKHSNGTFIQL